MSTKCQWNSAKVLGRGLQHACNFVFSFGSFQFGNWNSLQSRCTQFHERHESNQHTGILKSLLWRYNSQSVWDLSGDWVWERDWPGTGFWLVAVPAVHKHGNPRNGKASTSWTRVIRGGWVCVSGGAFQGCSKKLNADGVVWLWSKALREESS